MAVRVSQLWSSIADAGRDLLRGRVGSRRPSLDQLCRDLLSTRGDASGAALAREVVEAYRSLADSERLAFFTSLARDYPVDPDSVHAAAARYRDQPGLDSLRACAAPPRGGGSSCSGASTWRPTARARWSGCAPSCSIGWPTTPSWPRSTPTCRHC
jgi:hypothetical protein